MKFLKSSKKILFLSFVYCSMYLSSSLHAQDNVGIGTNTPNASAILELLSANKGLLIPRMNTAGMAAIASPANSLLIYNTDSMCYCFYKQPSLSWVSLCHSGSGGGSGSNGATGSTGATGSVGAVGSTGAIGSIGATGTVGSMGSTGSTGAIGSVGSTGADLGTHWTITGNAGTVAGTNFIGTTDAQDFVIKTNGSAATKERMRALSGGNVIVNNTTIGSNTSDVFSVYSDGTTNGSTTNINSLGDYAINGYSSGLGSGIYGANTSIGTGVYGSSTSFGNGVLGVNTATGIGVYGLNTAVKTGVEGDVYNPLFPQSITTGTSMGVFGYNNSVPTGSAFTAGVLGTAISTTGKTNGVYGKAASADGFGVDGFNTNASGTGVMGIGNNLTGSYLPSGGGGAFEGTVSGVYATTTSATGVSKAIEADVAATTGVGSIAVFGNNLSTTAGAMGIFGQTAAGSGTGTGTGAGVVGLNTAAPGTTTSAIGTVGVIGYTTTTATALSGSGLIKAGGYFENDVTYCYVGATYEGINYKVLGPGGVATIVDDVNNKPVIMFCPEAPEVLFQDYGSGKLVNGKAQITLDPSVTKNIFVDEKHPLRAFVQLEGDCKGVYVTNKTATGFEVVELNGGTSNVSFTWTITANRIDEPNSTYQSVRFPAAPHGGRHFTPIGKGVEPAKAITVGQQPVVVPQTPPQIKKMFSK